MKKLLTSLMALVSLTGAASAIRAEEGPVGEKLRSRFCNGRAPTIDELVNKTRNCRLIGITSDSEMGFVKGLVFESYGSGTVIGSRTLIGGVILSQAYQLDSHELYGSYNLGSETREISWRVDDEGYLISEYSVAPGTSSDKNRTPCGKHTHSNTLVNTYAVCN